MLAWAFYDWANSAFATTVMAGFFPVFYKQFWSSGVAVTESTFRLGVTNSLASLVIVCLAPILGAIADQAGAKKGFLLFFTSMGIVMTGALYLVAEGSWIAALALYGLGLVGFTGSNIFYDALLVAVSDIRSYEKVSALGFALGYLGGGLLFAFDVMTDPVPGEFRPERTRRGGAPVVCHGRRLVGGVCDSVVCCSCRNRGLNPPQKTG